MKCMVEKNNKVFMINRINYVSTEAVYKYQMPYQNDKT